MASIFLKSSTTILFIFSTLSIAAAAGGFVLDSDGEPLFNGRQYYMIPQTIGIGGGLTRTTKDDYTPCPYYVTRDKDETSNGMPLTISSPLKILYLPESSSVSIAFQEMITVCIQSMGWGVVPDDSAGKLYVATGGDNVNWKFLIKQAEEESRNNVYNIRIYNEQSSKDSNVGFFEDDGLLGVTDDIPLKVMFKKAFDVIEL
ncbi:kunitz trypsin inhibitor 4-like [Amaranthus tricolor]|uniref:kunitz trypsin inhibitor 4-like n=1 Tax=Amaranthus tricolor TaxID=29722 RepID=UPI0025835EF9|nr:kunitz trypsin inhibitor 4-like [Amaranthus tricolor]